MIYNSYLVQLILIVFFCVSNSAICFCENDNGFGDKSGILCEGKDSVYRKSKCLSNQWCTGASNLSSTVTHYTELCEDGNAEN